MLTGLEKFYFLKILRYLNHIVSTTGFILQLYSGYTYLPIMLIMT